METEKNSRKSESFDWDNFEQPNFSSSSVEKSELHENFPNKEQSQIYQFEQSRFIADISMIQNQNSKNKNENTFNLLRQDSREEPVEIERYKHMKYGLEKKKQRIKEAFFENLNYDIEKEKRKKYEDEYSYDNYDQFKGVIELYKKRKREVEMMRELMKKKEQEQRECSIQGQKEYCEEGNPFTVEQHSSEEKQKSNTIQKEEMKLESQTIPKPQKKHKMCYPKQYQKLITNYLEMRNQAQNFHYKIKESEKKKQFMIKQITQLKEIGYMKKQKEKQERIKYVEQVEEIKRQNKDKNVRKLCKQIGGLSTIENDAKYINISEKIESLYQITNKAFSEWNRKDNNKCKVINYFPIENSLIEQKPSFNESSIEKGSIKSQSSMNSLKSLDGLNITSPFDINLLEESQIFTQKKHNPRKKQSLQNKNLRHCLTQKKAIQFQNSQIMIESKSRLIFDENDHPLIVELKISNRCQNPIYQAFLMAYKPENLIVKPNNHNYHQKLQKSEYFKVQVRITKKCLQENGFQIKVTYKRNSNEKKRDVNIKIILPLIPLIKPEFTDSQKLMQIWSLLPYQITCKVKKEIKLRQINKILPFKKINEHNFMLLYRYPKVSLLFLLRLERIQKNKFKLILRTDEIEEQKLKQQMLNTFHYLLQSDTQ